MVGARRGWAGGLYRQWASVETGQALTIPPAVLDVLGSRDLDEDQVRLVRTHDGWNAHGQSPGRHLHVVGHDGIGTDGGPVSDQGVVENHRSGADQTLVLQHAPFEMSQMADDAAVADHGGEPRSGVDDRSVLDRRPSADGDGAEIAAEHRAGPHAGVRPQDDVADDHRFGVDIGIGIDGRNEISQLVDGHHPTLRHRAAVIGGRTTERTRPVAGGVRGIVSRPEVASRKEDDRHSTGTRKASLVDLLDRPMGNTDPGEVATEASPAIPSTTGTGLAGGSDTVDRAIWSLVWLGVLSGGIALWGSWSSWSVGAIAAPLITLIGGAGLVATWLVVDPRSPLLQIAALGAAVVTVLSGQGVSIHDRRFYNTDAAAFNQVATRVLAHGSNPYTTSMASAARLLHVPSEFWTYTVTGTFVDHVSYPAGSFLVDLPAYLLGFHHETVDWVDLYAWIVTGVLVFFLLPTTLRWLGVLLLLTPAFVGTFGSGGTDAAFLPFLVLAVWRWDRFGCGRTAGLARWMGPVALGVACSIKQTPWFCLPFLVLGLWIEARRDGRRPGRVVLRYLAMVGSVFAAVNLPFILWGPAAWVRGTLLPFRTPLIPDGQGLVTLALHGAARGVSLPLLTVAGAVVLLTSLLAFVVWYPAMKRIWMLVLPVIFFVAPRSLSTYLLDLVPAALVAAVSVGPARRMDRQRAGGTGVALGLGLGASALASLVLAVLAFVSPPLQIGVQSVATSGRATSLNSVTVIVHNNTDRSVTPHFMVGIADTNPSGFWNPAHHRMFALGPHSWSRVTLYPASYTGSPLHGSHWLVEAYTSSPEALSTSTPQLWRLGPAQ